MTRLETKGRTKEAEDETKEVKKEKDKLVKGEG